MTVQHNSDVRLVALLRVLSLEQPSYTIILETLPDNLHCFGFTRQALLVVEEGVETVNLKSTSCEQPLNEAHCGMR